jgi:Protein of unknown function (DUF3710)
VVSWRRRRPAEAEGAPEAEESPAPAEDGATEAVTGPPVDTDPPLDRSGGPFDVTEVDDDLPRIDLGALHLPAVPGMELRLEVEDGTRRVVAATVGLAGSTAQVQVFAAPRTEGIWREVRREIAASVTAQGGTADELDGPLGPELLARVPMRTEDGRTAHRPARFVGVDGPRWFLRAVLSGPAAADPGAAAPLEALLRGTVVVRGTEAMAPRDLLALQLPQGAAAPEGPGPAEGDGAPLDRPGE